MEDQTKPEAPKWIKYLSIPLTIIFGAAGTYISKLMYQQEAYGVEGRGKHAFKKPYLRTTALNMGMLLGLGVYGLQHLFAKNKPEKPTLKEILFILLLACFDTLATTFRSISLLYLQASVYQMFRGSLVLFSWILSITYLKRKNYLYMTCSVISILVGLTSVGVSVIVQTGLANESVTKGQVILAIILVVVSQLVQAIQIVFEDHLLHDARSTSEFIVGFKGFWGTLIAILLLVIVQFLPGKEGNGFHEDTKDSFIMMGNNWVIILFYVLYIFFLFGFNVYGMYVTEVTDAVVRTIIEGMRALAIWIVDIVLYYSIKAHSGGDPEIGAKLNTWTLLEFFGFLLLFFGTLTYKHVIKLPFFKYPTPEPSEESSLNEAETTKPSSIEEGEKDVDL